MGQFRCPRLAKARKAERVASFVRPERRRGRALVRCASRPADLEQQFESCRRELAVARALQWLSRQAAHPMASNCEVTMTGTQHDDFDFSSLSLKDLIEARDLYHFHLMSKANVVGTAIGLYLIRKEEDWPQARGEGVRPRRKLTFPRTFANSEVRDYSWPCILVLVREWIDEEDFGKKGMPAPWLTVPKRLYLPDGRIVPVCIVLAPPVPDPEAPGGEPVAWPKATFGGGLPVYVEVQHETHMATLSCLMSDGHTTYALTARHACGEPGTEVSAMLREGLSRIGVSSDKQITRKLFSEVYPALPLRQTWLGLDVGLVRVENAGDWTPNIY